MMFSHEEKKQWLAKWGYKVEHNKVSGDDECWIKERLTGNEKYKGSIQYVFSKEIHAQFKRFLLAEVLKIGSSFI